MLNSERLRKSFRHAMRGITCVFQEEQNVRIHVLCGFFAILFAALFKFSVDQFVIVCILISLVIGAELMNSAFERCIDIMHPRVANYVRDAKDIMAGAVLLFSVAALIGGVALYLPPLIRFITTFFIAVFG